MFSQWHKGLPDGGHYLRIDGEVKNRQELIDEFNRENSPKQLFLISTKAGNMGINLQVPFHLHSTQT